jgi:DHA3 family macrolide efflux protein-like MFS transporter
MLVSAVLFGSVVKVRRHLLVVYLGLLGIGITSAIGGLLPPTMAAWCVFAVVCGLMGAFGNVYSIPLTAFIQESVDPGKMGRAFSVLTLMASVAMPLGLAIASPLAEMMGVSLWFLIAGLGMSATAAIGLVANGRLR